MKQVILSKCYGCTGDYSDGKVEVAAMLIGEVKKSGNRIIRITVEPFKGHTICNVRQWVPDSSGEMVPTPAGITLNAFTLKEVLPLLEEAAEELEAKG